MEVIEQILAYPPYDGKMQTRTDLLAPPNISVFKNIDPVLLYPESGPDWFVFPDTTPKAVWPFELSLVKQGEEHDWYSLFLSHFTPISPKQVRGLPCAISPYMGLLSFACADKRHGGKMVTARSVVSFLGGKWVEAENRKIWQGRSGKEIPSAQINDAGISNTLLMMNGVALRHRYEWAVSLGVEKCPSVRFATDPTGIKELFRLRDVPDGRDKRSALMNWVSDHWRQDRKDPDVETYVRKHLRGSNKFTWRGFEATLLPSAYDMETVERLKQQRSEMKNAGSDRRPAA